MSAHKLACLAGTLVMLWAAALQSTKLKSL